MSKLFTKHDAFHIHAIIGILCLIHFLYRYLRLCVYGCAFGEYELHYVHTKVFDTFCVLFHVLLHTTSFQFHLPAQRSEKRPMIWTEFRFHSAVFAFRHICCTLSQWWLSTTFYENGGNVCFVVLTILFAKEITQCFGNTQKRTTNAMPYPENTNVVNIKLTKAFYATAQFGATTCAIWGPPTVAFLPICAIEIAPFMMTLVRKGKATVLQYHQIYTIALLIHYLLWFVCMQSAHSYHSLQWVLCYVCTNTLIYPLRFRNCSIPTHLAWVIATVIPLCIRHIIHHMTYMLKPPTTEHILFIANTCISLYFAIGVYDNVCSISWQYGVTNTSREIHSKMHNIPVR